MNIRDNEGRTPLHHAVQCEQVDNIWYLLNQGADINAKNDEEETVLHLVSKTCPNPQQILILPMLVGKGANLNIQNDKGMTALHLAIQSGEDQNVYCLVDSDAAMDIKNTDLHSRSLRVCSYSSCCIITTNNKHLCPSRERCMY